MIKGKWIIKMQYRCSKNTLSRKRNVLKGFLNCVWLPVTRRLIGRLYTSRNTIQDFSQQKTCFPVTFPHVNLPECMHKDEKIEHDKQSMIVPKQVIIAAPVKI